MIKNHNNFINKAKINLQDHNNKFSYYNITHSKECDTCINSEFGYDSSCDTCCHFLLNRSKESNKNHCLNDVLIGSVLNKGYFEDIDNDIIIIGLFFNNGLCATSFSITTSDDYKRFLKLSMDEDMWRFIPKFKSLFKKLSELSKKDISVCVEDIANILENELLYTKVTTTNIVKLDYIKDLASNSESNIKQIMRQSIKESNFFKNLL